MVHLSLSYNEEKTLLCVPNVTIQPLKCSDVWFCLGFFLFLFFFMNFLVLVVIPMDSTAIDGIEKLVLGMTIMCVSGT